MARVIGLLTQMHSLLKGTVPIDYVLSTTPVLGKIVVVCCECVHIHVCVN